MSVVERGQNFVKEMSELNVRGISKYFDIQREAIETYVEANRKRFAALRDVKDVGDFVNAQREYFDALQKNVAGTVEKQVQLARENFEATGKLWRDLFQQDAPAAQPTPAKASKSAAA